jgi:putative SOS response-associated peptidase YedK
VDTCAIVTTQANLFMEQIHNSKKRMPTILTDDLAWEWMFGKLTEKRISEIESKPQKWVPHKSKILSKNNVQKYFSVVYKKSIFIKALSGES